MKKIFTLVVALCACVFSAYATEYATATKGTTYYSTNGCTGIGLADGTVAVYEYWATSTDVVIPHDFYSNDESAGYPTYEVSQVGYNDGEWDWDFTIRGEATRATITSLTLSEGIKKLDGKTFWDATALQTITLPSTFEQIVPKWFFRNSTALTKIVCNAATAPTLAGEDFPWKIIENKTCRVVVPDGAAASYNQVGDNWTYWGGFYSANLVHESTPVTISANGYTTYYNDYGYIMPEGVKGYMVTGINEDKSAYLTEIYNEGDSVCNKIALLLKSTRQNNDTEFNFEVFASGGNTAHWPMDGTSYYTNLLDGTQTEQAISPYEGNYYYYTLNNDADKGLAFYWGEENGGVFTNAAHTAYLAVEQATAGADNSRIPFISKEGTVAIDGVTYTLYNNGEAIVTDNPLDPYLRGGDVSELNYVENFGARFYNTDADSTQMDALRIMKRNGCNIVRLRLYNNPGTAVTTNGGTFRVPEGYLDSTDVLNLAKRAKELRMKIVLSFHYSDYWTNALEQFKPNGWSGYSLDELKQAVYDYTYNFLQKMKAQGTSPDYVALGNEIRSGILFGYKGKEETVNGSTSGNLADLLNQGSAAVRAACPDAKIILHLPMDASYTTGSYTNFFNNYGKLVDFDVVGASYYPYWTDMKPADVLPTLASTMYKSFNKEVMIMETGYSWTQYRPEGRNGGQYEGQLHLNGDKAYNEATEAGQKTFIQDLQTVIKANSHILGYLYWDPVMVDQQVDGKWIETCWAEKLSDGTWYQNGNMVSNATLFNYTGHALPAFEAIKEDAPVIPETIESEGKTYKVVDMAPIPDTPDTPTVYGDVNGDSKVDVADVTAVLGVMYGTASYTTADVNNDGHVDIADVTAILGAMYK